MISDRRTNRVWYNASTEKIIVTIESINCSRESMDSVLVLHSLMKQLADNPNLLECAESKIPETVTITHNGTKWVVKLEALVPRIF